MLTLCHPLHGGLPGSSVCGVFQARILSGLPFPPPGDLADAGIELGSPALQGNSLLLSHCGSWVWWCWG